ncbi:MAG: NADH-quinone oxidoreductase subunit M, partial [Anaerolineales bacterium]|nr:NADH-quinone oxidoreductase subunit M [Anaerolineales bacterium]
LTLYLLIGSFISIIFFLVAYFNMDAAIRTFDLRVWADYNFDRTFQIWMFLPIFMGFAVLGGTFPFHNWSPIGHLAAPTAVSMIHAGVLMKLGAYAAMRVGIQLFPEGAVYWMPFIILLTLINVIYGSLIAMRQTDLKYMIGYSSVSHMGLVAMGFAAMNVEGFTGAGIQMVSHGVMTALFFSVVGMIYDRAHTRNMEELGGMMKVLPWPMVAFVMASLVSMGMPGLSGFIAEFPIFLGVWKGGTLDLSGLTTGFSLNPASYYPWVALISVLGIVITAAYLVRAIGNVFLGEYDEHKWHDMRPILPIDKVVLVSFVLVMVAIGMFPEIIEPIVRAGIDPVVNRLDQAREAATLLDTVHVAATNFFSWLGGGA